MEARDPQHRHEKQHAHLFAHRLRQTLKDTLTTFGQTMRRTADAARDELAHALVDTGHRIATSEERLQAHLRAGRGEEPQPQPGTEGVEQLRGQVPGQHVEVTSTPRRMDEVVEGQDHAQPPLG